MKHIKISETVAYLMEKAERIELRLACLLEGERYQDFVGDPQKAPLWECTSCEVLPELQRKSNGKLMYCCPVCNKMSVGKNKIITLLRWNRLNCIGHSLGEVPFRVLQQAGQPKDNIINYLCSYYSLKKKYVGLQRQIAQKRQQRPPGKDYQKRLEAFHEWAMLARDLLEFE